MNPFDKFPAASSEPESDHVKALSAKVYEISSEIEKCEKAPVPPEIAQTKQHRQDLDGILQRLKRDSEKLFTGIREPGWRVRSSRERSLAVTKIQEAIMWLGMDLKAINDESPGAAPNPYPSSYDPSSPKIEPTSEGLKL